MAKLAGFDDAPVYERLPAFTKSPNAGTYIAEVVEMKEFTSALDDAQTYFKSTFKVLEAAPGSGLQAGDQVSEIESLFGQYKKSAFGRVKTLIGACTGERASQITTKDYEEAVSPENPVAGAKVKVFASPKPNSQYNSVSWMAYSPPA